MSGMLDDAIDDVVMGVRTRVYATGAAPGAPTLVMVHGGDPRSLSNATDFSTVWDRAALPGAPRLLAYDKPGQGFSFHADEPRLGFDIDALTEHLRAVVDRHTTGPVVLMGHSRGALPVLDLATAAPDGLAGVVVVASNTVAPESELTPRDFYPRAYADPPRAPTAEYTTREARMNSYDERHVAGVMADTRMAIASAPGWWASVADRDAAHATRLLPQFTAARERLLAALDARRVEVPVLTIWGADDVSAPEILGRALHPYLERCFSSADYVVLGKARHYVYRDRAHGFTGVVGAWLADRVAGAGHGWAVRSNAPGREQR